MIAQVTGSPQKSPNVSPNVKKLIARLEGTGLQSPPSTTSSSHTPGGSPRRQPRVDAKIEAEHSRGASVTSQSSLDTLKIESGVSSSEQDSEQAEDELRAGGPRDSTPMPPEDPPDPPDPSVNNPASPTSGPSDQRPSALDELLSPTTSSLPHTPSLPRDSVAGSDLGSVRLDDDERFSTVSLNAAATRESTAAIKSPIDEDAPKPWTEDEPPPAPSEVSNSSIRTSFLLQRLGNDATPGQRRSVDGQQKLQEVFERAQQNSNELEEAAANVDWGECSMGPSGSISPLTRL
jgi:hypothetical protein